MTRVRFAFFFMRFPFVDLSDFLELNGHRLKEMNTQRVVYRSCLPYFIYLYIYLKINYHSIYNGVVLLQKKIKKNQADIKESRHLKGNREKLNISL